jgi:hypothetical protein
MKLYIFIIMYGLCVSSFSSVVYISILLIEQWGGRKDVGFSCKHETMTCNSESHIFHSHGRKRFLFVLPKGEEIHIVCISFFLVL